MLLFLKNTSTACRFLTPEAVWRRAMLYGQKYLNRFFYPRYGSQVTDGELLAALRLKGLNVPEFLHAVKNGESARFFFRYQEKDQILAALKYLAPDYEARVMRAADAVCRHEFDLLGSGVCFTGFPIDWQADFKTGYRWDASSRSDHLHATTYPGGADIKVPWELSRCQHFAWLGQAYWLSGDEKYALEFRSEIEDWTANNPRQYGVNWVCTMDVALRAVNWLWGFAYFRQSPSLDDSFLLLFYRSLLEHGRFIFNHLEWTLRLTSNHYLANLVGLVYLGIMLPEFKESTRWREFGLKELEKEMRKQVYRDGASFEASTHYHRLATELFLSAALLAERNGHSFSSEFCQRLERMIDAVRWFSHPDGTAPVVGDQDNGRVHRLMVWQNPEREWLDFRPLVAIGAIWKQNPEWAAWSTQWREEAVWMFGGCDQEIFQQKPQAMTEIPHLVEYPEGGWYILQNDHFHVLAELGENGQNGMGGHAHNDTLSFDLYCNGHCWIQDPGTYLYTADYVSRNLFRSTQLHNTVCVAGLEQNRFDPQNLFQMENLAVQRVLYKESTQIHTLLVGEVWYPPYVGVIHRRAFLLAHDLDAFVISDRVTGGTGARHAMFHCSQTVTCQISRNPQHGVRLEMPDQSGLWLIDMHPEIAKIQSQQNWVSLAYGSRAPGQVVTFDWNGEDINTIAILPDGKEVNLPERLQKLEPLQTWLEQCLLKDPS